MIGLGDCLGCALGVCCNNLRIILRHLMWLVFTKSFRYQTWRYQVPYDGYFQGGKLPLQKPYIYIELIYIYIGEHIYLRKLKGQ